jgi:hypothetical protein
MPRFAWSHHCRARLTPAGRRTSSVTIRACLNKKTSVCLRREDKPSQKLLDSGEDGKRVIDVSPPLRHLRRRDDATILDIVVIERARYGEYR